MRKIMDNKIFRIIFTTVKTIFVICLVLYVGFLFFQRMSNNSSLFGYRVFTIATGSMEPVYNVNDVILVKEEDYHQLKVGDDVTYLGATQDFEGRIVTHRIIEINEEEGTLQTQGVANDTADPVIKSDQLYGKVVYRSVILSFITNLIHNKIGFYFLIFFPLVLVIFLEVADIVTQSKSDDEDEEEPNKE